MKLLILLFSLLPNLFSQVTPKVLWNEQLPLFPSTGEPFKYRVKVSGPVTRVAFLPTGSTTEQAFTSLANDLWELQLTTPDFAPREIYSKFLGLVRLYQGSTMIPATNVVIHGHSNDLPPVRITKLAEDLQRSDYVLNLNAPSLYANIYNSQQQFSPVTALESSLRRIYQSISDDFDFVHFILADQMVAENRYHSAVRNSISGIGLTTFDNAAVFGSKAKLLGYTVFPNPHFIDGASEGTAHELGHQWVQFVKNIPASGQPHWPLSSMATGIMGWSDPVNYQGLNFPCLFTPAANNGYNISYAAGPRLFTDFDLYLMGLISPAEVRSQTIITDPQKIMAAQLGSCAGVPSLSAGQYQVYTIQDLIQSAGAPRSPSASNSQKSFRVLNLVLSRDGLLRPNDMAYFEALVRRIEEKGLIPYNEGRLASTTFSFGVATGNRATVSARLTTNSIPEISYGGIANAGSFSTTSLTSGTVASLFGSSLATTTASASSVPLPTTLGGLRVLVEGQPAPLFFVSPTQINFQLPYGLKLNPIIPSDSAYYTSVRVERDGVSSNASYIQIRASGPGIITYGNNNAVAVTSGNTVIGADNPAKPGDTITIYFIGSGPLSESITAGTAAPLDRLIRVTGTNGISFGGTSYALEFMGLTPGGVGLLQANFRIPSSAATGVYPIVLSIGGTNSNEAKLAVSR